jgi:hypothetical protein
MNAVVEQEFDTRLQAGIRAALRKARELGYEVEQMDVTASVVDELCSVQFAPRPVPGTISTGGDLSLTVDPRTEQIVETRRGQ